MDYFHAKQNIQPTKGDLLISEPYLPDPNFDRTVVLICEHDKNGTFGYILNQLSETSIGELIIDLEGNMHPVYVGGPVQQDTLHFIHKSRDNSIGGQEIGPGLFWGGDYERVIELIKLGLISDSEFRFFMGYSGWGMHQLQNEIDTKSWFIYKNPSTDMLFETPAGELWQTILNNLGGKFRMISKYPTDPRMN